MLFLMFVLIALIYLTCRSVDKCLAKNHWFHHRGYLSTKELKKLPKEQVEMTGLKNMTNLSSFPQHLSTPSVPTPTQFPKTNPRVKRTNYVNQTSAQVPENPQQTVTNVDRLNQMFGFQLSEQQKENIKKIILEPQDSFSNPNFIGNAPEPNQNVYDTAATGDESGYANDEVVTRTAVQVHREARPTEVRQMPALTPRALAEALDKAGLPVRCFFN
jgi:hypothetical protein